MTNVVKFKKEPLELLRSVRVGSPNTHTIQLEFNRELTKGEFEFFYETCERTAFLMRGITND